MPQILILALALYVGVVLALDCPDSPTASSYNVTNEDIIQVEYSETDNCTGPFTSEAVPLGACLRAPSFGTYLGGTLRFTRAPSGGSWKLEVNYYGNCNCSGTANPTYAKSDDQECSLMANLFDSKVWRYTFSLQPTPAPPASTTPNPRPPVDGELRIDCDTPTAFVESEEARVGVRNAVGELGGVSTTFINVLLFEEAPDYNTPESTTTTPPARRLNGTQVNQVIAQYSINFPSNATMTGMEVATKISDTPKATVSSTVAAAVQAMGANFNLTVRESTAVSSPTPTSEPAAPTNAAPITAAPTTTEAPASMPAWGWVLIVLGVVAVIALIAGVVCMGGDKKNKKSSKKRGLNKKGAAKEPEAAPAAPAAQPLQPVQTSIYPVATYQPVYHAAPVAQHVYHYDQTAMPVQTSAPVYAAPAAPVAQHVYHYDQTAVPVQTSAPVYAATGSVAQPQQAFPAEPVAVQP